MNCQHAQELWNEPDRLPAAQADALQQHLAGCSDCRVLRQRERRLQQLLSLKRHERPPGAYFDRILNEFHRRLDAEEQQVHWWQHAFDLPVWRYGLTATAAASLCVAAALLAWPRANHPPVAGAASAKPAPEVFAAANTNVVLPVSEGVVLIPASAPAGDPGYVLDRIKITPASYETSSVRF